MKDPMKTPRDNQADGTDEEVTGKDAQTKPTTKNPPWTTTGKVTSPKFGSAGSGGAEFEPGPEKD